MTFSDFPVRRPGVEGSCVGVLSMFHVGVTVAVGNLKKECCLSRRAP